MMATTMMATTMAAVMITATTSTSGPEFKATGRCQQVSCQRSWQTVGNQFIGDGLDHLLLVD